FIKGVRDISAEAPISLYLHIPYCREICWYCGCNTGAASKEKRLTSYLAALEAEIIQVAERLDGRGRIRHIAFGGGSPNAIAPVEFVRLMDRVRTMFRCDDPQISVELDPRIFSVEWAATLARCGVSRVSLGVQSFSDSIQRAIGRTQPLHMIENCIWQLRETGIKGINFDLMYGLPGQSQQDLFETLEITAGLAPDRIALFGYAHMPQLFPRQRRIDDSALPNSAERFAMAELGYRYFTKAGYAAIGFDHFAKPDDSLAIAARVGKLRRNFQGFTDDNSDILVAMGASAISHFPDYIIQNAKNVGDYRALASAHQVCAVRGVVRNADDQLRGKLIENLLCTGNSGPIPDAMRDEITTGMQPFAERGLARLDNGCIIIEADGVAYARAVASLLDAYRQPATRQFSPAV
ncbi:oxygen-independent coproporphyrinogen III oxidase, partial [Sphingorhabdus sp.]|uniref:oxygen-independent coproporphyrinogen III oxidase n=1 Tax=Sphingorhabdus sp. TaxID=1902408 RepID=UPI0039191497